MFFILKISQNWNLLNIYKIKNIFILSKHDLCILKALLYSHYPIIIIPTSILKLQVKNFPNPHKTIYWILKFKSVLLCFAQDVGDCHPIIVIPTSILKVRVKNFPNPHITICWILKFKSVLLCFAQDIYIIKAWSPYT